MGTAPAATACTELTEDDTVFAVITPLEATCYLEHDTPVVASIYPAGRSTSVGSGLHAHPTGLGLRPLGQLSVFDKQGVFKHKKVALFGGGFGDESELALVQSALAQASRSCRDHGGRHRAPRRRGGGRTHSSRPIAQRFQSDGVNEVVAVGTGAAVWPEGLSAIESTYNPPWVATSEPTSTAPSGLRTVLPTSRMW